ncbi:MAG: tRNA pseudouridine(55) synthase TruB [Gemmatimonadetes bacterium]|nr:tRNA pseudouridine(55) synthase TruB [Gemmatimonadota bacterium]NIQ52653.1 tRNA pseudouridine(55) synthase TruB [Gemmatimonadota bacterium]NIU72785.1 tRNA pseudouridine(55) synthase TruB [Gammaproteobacteria bacterium]NIX43179.1 tRNA pseudouridine(55) synthase TruB [Gemmatimonadota bacterium]NIY07342.1 tRNA pseudouridine(55) synthase TruB [Gemmatimonadota bacterium]
MRIRRIGHTGTLDPFATGLLLLCVGTATRLAEYLTGLDKSYEATARLGVATDTLDREGTVTAESDDWRRLDPRAIRSAFTDQQGRRLQAPPAYSAKKIRGRRAYELAREGAAVQPEPVPVEIHAIEVTAIDGPEVRFRIRCGSGTYVRAVARDAGEALGVGAHLTALRRTRVGGFGVDRAVPMDRLDDPVAVAAALIAPLDALAHLPVVGLEAEEARRVGHGQPLEARGRAAPGLAALTADGALIAVAESDGTTLRPRKVFA